MRYQTFILLVFSFITLISAIQIEPEVEHASLEARAKKPKKGKVNPKPKPLPKKKVPAPKPKQQPKKDPSEVKCDPLSKYSSSYFISNMCAKPKAGKCLFYTRGLSSTAAAYARSNDFTTIWDMWDKSLYDNSIVKRNPLRCIMQDKKDGGQMRRYFAAMSKAMAFQCDGFVTVMDKGINANNKKFGTLIQTGIWYNVEFPQLKIGGFGKKAQQIEAISPDGKVAFTYWTRASGNQNVKNVKRAGNYLIDEAMGAGNETKIADLEAQVENMELPAEVEQAIDDMDVDEFFAAHENKLEDFSDHGPSESLLTKRTKSPIARCVNGVGAPGSAKNFDSVSW